MSLVRSMREITLRDGGKVLLDLTQLHSIQAGAVLKLHAEIQVIRALSIHADDSIKILWPSSYRPKSFLSRVGFGSKDKEVMPDINVPGLLPLCSHTTANSIMLDLLSNMNRSIYNGDLQVSGAEWDSLHKALSEAMLNVEMHAYEHIDTGKSQILKEFGKRWWLMAETHHDQLYIALFDKGIGIPKALSYYAPTVETWLNMVTSRFTNPLSGPDSKRIAAATVVGKSGLKKSSGHGHGLEDIRQFVMKNPEGRLLIFSNRGCYIFDAATGKETLHEQSQSIHGTLIQWNVSLATESKDSLRTVL